MEWNDLQLVLILARAGSLTEAAREAGVHQSTMSRRLLALEERMGLLFLRQPLSPTTLGRRVLAYAEQIAMQMDSLALEIEGHRAEAVGLVRVATSLEVAMWALAPAMGQLLSQHPGLDVQLIEGDNLLDLSRAEADLAIRARVSGPEEDVVVMPAGNIQMRVLQRPGAPPYWLTLNTALPWADDARWVASYAPEARCRLQTTSMGALLEAVRAGSGRAWLPQTLMPRYPELEEVSVTPPPLPAVPLYIVVHRELRRVPRIVSVIDWVREILRGL